MEKINTEQKESIQELKDVFRYRRSFDAYSNNQLDLFFFDILNFIDIDSNKNKRKMNEFLKCRGYKLLKKKIPKEELE
ncbi:MAG TPA: hypothetical protein ENH46_05645 [Candidatus Pacearchaeota archaeon]|nr:hypothetical protein [Candidatus Pacearchaeota archaeon]